MTEAVDWSEVAKLLRQLYSATSRLEEIFPGRKFTLDGHLVGSVGEVIAAHVFGLTLKAASTAGHDATSRDGRRVEIKLTQGSSVSLRDEPQHLLVLRLQKGGPVSVVYNGPGHDPWEAAGEKQKNGQRPIGLRKLGELDKGVDPALRLRVVRDAPALGTTP